MKASKVGQKVILFLVSFSLFISCITISATAANGGKLGDINSDGSINSTDVTLLKRHLLRENILTGTAYSNADTDGDGKITSIDLSYLKRYVLRLISSFPGETSNNLNIPWDWVGIIGTGQSLSVGTTPIFLFRSFPFSVVKHFKVLKQQLFRNIIHRCHYTPVDICNKMLVSFYGKLFQGCSLVCDI